MSVATEISKLQTNLMNAYSTVEEKGATLPANQNFDNLANAISSIPSGGGSQTKYGATINSILGDTNASGILQLPLEETNFSFTGVKDIVDYCLYNKFSYQTNIKTVLFPDLESLSNTNSLNHAFYFCTALTSVSFPKLEVISGTNTLSGSFYYCTALTSVSFPKLTSITSSQLDYTFSDCTSLTTVSFPELTTMSAMLRFSDCTSLTTVSFPKLNNLVANNKSDKNVFNYSFSYCTKLKDIYFNSLKTTSFGSYKKQFQYMFSSGTATTSNPCTVHFPSNLSSKIATLTGYPLFGGTNGKVVLSFDLPATS